MINYLAVILFLFQAGVSPTNTKEINTCETFLEQAKQARANKDLPKEIQILEKAITMSCKQNSKAYSQLSLCYLEIGDQSYSDRGSKDKKTRNEMFSKALKKARVSAHLDSTNKFAFEHKAMAFAGILDVNGIKDKVQLADSVRINAEIALHLDPNNDRALHILGRWHYEVSQFGGFLRFLARLFFGTAPKASIDDALSYFKRAVALDDYPVHNYWLALTYLELNDKTKAKWHLNHILELKDEHHNDEYFKNKARDYLKDL